MNTTTNTADKTTSDIPKSISQESTIVEWQAPERPYKKRNREFYTTVGSIVFLLIIILFLVREFLLIGVILTFAFLSYILAYIPPETITHTITTKGIRTDNKLFKWDTLVSFWIQKKWNQEIVVIQTTSQIPKYIMLIIDAKKRDKILSELGKRIPLEEMEESFVDKASKWIQEKIPLENS